MKTTLANWVGTDRVMLLRQLSESVKPSKGPEKRLFDELLLRLVRKEDATIQQPVLPIGAEEAATMMGVRWNGSADQALYPVVIRLSGKIKKASKTLLPSPGAYLTHEPYSIEVSENPPSLTKKYPELCIGLILADATDWFVGDVLKGIAEASGGKYDLIVELSTYSQKTEARMIPRLAERVHGILLVAVGDHVLETAIQSLRKSHCVLIDRYLLNVPELPCVHPADKMAGRYAALYLRERGCQRILVVNQGSRSGSTFTITPLKDRTDGCQEADDDLEVLALPEAGTDEQGGFDALRRFEMANSIRKTDGILALTDRVAVGCRNYLRTEQPTLAVPLISIEGQPSGDFIQPPLSA